MSLVVQHVSDLVSLSVSNVALNPLLSAPLLWVLTKGPTRIRNQLVDRFAVLRDPIRLARVLKLLKWLLALGVMRKVNAQLNRIAMNSGRFGSEIKRWKWEEEVAVVTGGSGGIGELIVKRLSAKGIMVAVLDVVALPVGLQGNPHVKYFPCDITNPEAVYSTAEKVRNTLGSPSILINNAGILASHTVLNTSDEHLRKIFDVNVLSNWYTVKAFLPQMIARNKGHIVTLASASSYIGVAGLGDYTSTKAAILSFHEALSQELALHHKTTGVLMTSIHPNWVQTPLIKSVQAELKRNGSSILEPTTVADSVVKCVLSASGGQVMLPESTGRIALLRALPNWVQENARSSIGKIILRSVM